MSDFPPKGIIERKVYGYPVFVHDIDWPDIEFEISNKHEWIHEFHIAAYKAVTEHGVKGDPVWDRLIYLTCHPKGEFGFKPAAQQESSK